MKTAAQELTATVKRSPRIRATMSPTPKPMSPDHGDEVAVIIAGKVITARVT